VDSRQWQLGTATPLTTFIKGGASFSAEYRALAGDRVDLFVARLTYSDAGSGIAYRAVVLPSESSPAAISVANGRTIRVNHALVAKSNRETQVMFWYDLDGQTTADLALAKAYTAFRLLVGRPPLANVVMAIHVVPASGRDDDPVLNDFVGQLFAAHSVRSGQP